MAGAVVGCMRWCSSLLLKQFGMGCPAVSEQSPSPSAVQLLVTLLGTAGISDAAINKSSALEPVGTL